MIAPMRKTDFGSVDLNEGTTKEIEPNQDSISEDVLGSEKNANYPISLSDQRAHRIINKILQLADYEPSICYRNRKVAGKNRKRA